MSEEVAYVYIVTETVDGCDCDICRSPDTTRIAAVFTTKEIAEAYVKSRGLGTLDINKCVLLGEIQNDGREETDNRVKPL